MKQIIHQASQLLCKKDEFHKVIQIDKRKAEVIPGLPLTAQRDALTVSTFDMCRNSQLNFKIRVRGEPSPLKLRLEYYDTSRKQALQPQQLLNLKGFLNVFVSNSTDNPQ